MLLPARVGTAAGVGKLEVEILTPGTNLREHAPISAIVDVATLPKAIGGDAVFIDEDGKEDETCTRGVAHPTVSTFLADLEHQGSTRSLSNVDEDVA